MAQAQRRRPQERTIDDAIRETRDVAGRLNNIARRDSPGDPTQNQAVSRLEQEYNRYRNMTPEERERARITPEQMERLQRAHDQLVRRITDIQSGRPGPQPGQRPAPQRVFNYDVTIGNGPDSRTFRITMGEPLRQPGSHVSERDMLLEMARVHDFFESEPKGVARVTTPGAPAPRIQVTQISGPQMNEFNNGPQMARVDNFEVALNRAREATPPTSITVVVAPQPSQTRGG
jgi:hypothetical protein